MALRTLSDIINDAVTFIQSKIPSLSLLQGTVARDVVVESPAQEFENVYVEVQRLRGIQSLNDPTQFEDSELDRKAADVGLTRTLGVASTGFVTFRANTLTSDITIPLGVELATAPTVLNTTVVSFTTVASGTMVAANAASFLNPFTGLYEISIPVQALSVGSTGNVAANSITTLVTSISGISTITNALPTSGGSDAESDISLSNRIRLKLSGNNKGTAAGIQGLIETNNLVLDSLIVRPGDPELLRDQFGNSVDVVVVGENLVQVSEPHTFNSSNLKVSLFRNPARSVSSITGTVSGSPYTFIEGTDYEVTIDLVSLFNGSTKANSYITFLSLGTLPDNSSIITITYTINKLVEDLQALLDDDTNKILASDVLVREAIKVLIQVGASIQVLPGFTAADVKSDVVTNVGIYLDALALGVDVDQSQLIAIMQDTTGVADVTTIPISLAVKRPTDTGFISVSDAIIARNEYGRADTITIT